MRWVLRLAPSAVALLVQGGLQVSGFQNIYAAIGLWLLASIWAVVALAIWFPVKSLRVRWPIFVESIPDSSDKPAKAATQAELVASSAFIRQIQAVAEASMKNVQPGYGSSLYNLFEKACQEPHVRAAREEDPWTRQLLRLFDSELSRLSNDVATYKAKSDRFIVASTDKDFQDICNNTARLIFDYNRLVEEFLSLLSSFGEKGLVAAWEEPWSRTIQRDLGDNYDELMRLVRDLRKDTPRNFRGNLPGDDATTTFAAKFFSRFEHLGF